MIETVMPIKCMKRLGDLLMPSEFYLVLKQPAPLAGMIYPYYSPWQTLSDEGFHSVVCLTGASPSYNPAPMSILKAVRFKDLCGGTYPDQITIEESELQDIVSAIKSELNLGRGVVVHCTGGTGRTGTVIACTLRALGMPVPDVLHYMQLLNVSRGKYRGWPESEWQSEQVRLWPDN